MKKILETPRLLLRELEISDAPDFYRLNENPEVLKYTGDVPFSNEEEAVTFLKNYSDYKRNGFGRWAVILKETNTFIGWCGLKRNEEQLVDIGFRLYENHWGNGYATEAAKACLEIGFTTFKIKEIIGRADLDNIASTRALEKIGMHFWKKEAFDGVENGVYYRIQTHKILLK